MVLNANLTVIVPAIVPGVTAECALKRRDISNAKAITASGRNRGSITACWDDTTSVVRIAIVQVAQAASDLYATPLKGNAKVLVL